MKVAEEQTVEARRPAGQSRWQAVAQAGEMNSDRAAQVPATNKRTHWISLAVVLLATLALALVWSHAKLLWVDELLVLETDGVGSAREVWHIQTTSPVSLDPAAYHLLAHAATRIFGVNRFAIRLPAMLGFLLMQACVYVVVRRCVGWRGALMAAIFPVLSGSFYYATEARPYGLLLGCFGLAVMCYQAATRDVHERRWALAGLAAALALAVNTHYFAVLIFGPLLLAEAVRTAVRRRFDVAVIGAVVAGGAATLFTLPLQPAAMRYRLHYYNLGSVDWHAIMRSYRLILLNLQFNDALERVSSVLLVVLCALCMAGALRCWLRQPESLPLHELLLLLGLALLPWAGFLLGRFVTHTMEVRYVLGAVVGLAALFGVAVGPWLQRRSAFAAVLLTGVAAATAISVYRIGVVQQESRAILASLRVTPEQKRLLLSAPDGLVLIQNQSVFQLASYYEPDREIRNQLAMVYSFAEEGRYGGRDTNSLTADHMQKFTNFRIVPWESLMASGGKHVWVVYPTTWDWAERASLAEGARVQRLGPALGGTTLFTQAVTKP